jgi:hypothetical protein
MPEIETIQESVGPRLTAAAPHASPPSESVRAALAATSVLIQALAEGATITLQRAGERPEQVALPGAEAPRVGVAGGDGEADARAPGGSPAGLATPDRARRYYADLDYPGCL